MREIPTETREAINRKKKIQGIEVFSEFGGFIGEMADSILYQSYPEEVSLLVDFYHGSGKGYVYVAEEVEKAFSYTSYEHNYLDNLRNRSKAKDTTPPPEELDYAKSLFNYHRWYVNNTARISAENFKSGNLHFWTGWKLSTGLRQLLSKLNPVEERILAMRLGIYSDKPLNTKEIASSEEFDCDELNIVMAIRNMEDMQIYPTKQECDELQNYISINRIKEGR